MAPAHPFSFVLPAFLSLTGPSLAAINGINIPGVQSGASTKPVTDLGALTIEQVAIGPGKTGQQAHRDDLLRWGVEPPTQVQAAAAATQTGSVAATPEPYDFSYLSPVTIGSSKFLLDFDTGSSDLWVFSTLQPASQRGTHNLYKLGGQKIDNEYWDISYADGSGASGVVYADKVTVGGATATVQAVEAATSVASRFVTRRGDGLLGLAFDSINTCYFYQCYTFMHQIAPTLPQPIFAANLKKGKPGTYDFGFIDTTKYTGKIGYAPADNSSGYWGIHPGAYSIGAGTKVKATINGIADTGTSLLYLPSSIVSAYYAKVAGAQNNANAGGYIFPCTSKLPNFSLFINGHKATVPGSYINAGANGDGTCFGGMQPDTNLPMSIVGDAFLKSQYVVHDLRGPRIGFAQQAGIPAN